MTKRKATQASGVVAPAEATGRMPDANVLEITDHKWTLLHRDKPGSTRVLAAGTY